MTTTKHPNALTKAERESMRPPECPNHNTKRVCGKAYRSGCRVGPCLANKEAERGTVNPKRTGVASKPAPRVELRKGFSPTDKSHGANWVLHGPECCRPVWRLNAWGCLK